MTVILSPTLLPHLKATVSIIMREVSVFVLENEDQQCGVDRPCSGKSKVRKNLSEVMKIVVKIEESPPAHHFDQ
jgi:hypothetical protein